MNNMNPDAARAVEGWGNSPIEAYTENHADRREFRRLPKIDTAPSECDGEADLLTLQGRQHCSARHGKCGPVPPESK